MESSNQRSWRLQPDILMSLLDPLCEAGWVGGLGLVREGQGGGDG